MNVTNASLAELFSFFANMKGDIDQYRDHETAIEALDRCTAMMSRDYLISMVENNFCPTYPKSLILLGHLDLEGEDPAPSGESRAHEQYSDKLKEMMEASRTCRCRQRIPVPVLVISNKIISRSAGLSEALELAYETGSMAPINDPSAYRKKMTALDTQWLRTLLVSDICDLMTEVKAGFSILSLVNSEKGIKEYSHEGFHLSSLPYPGVQYFKGYVDASVHGDYPVPPWHKWKIGPQFGRQIKLPSPYVWDDYKTWNQRELTQNIVRYLFGVLRHPKCSGLLVHCISGWDRTPHIIALLRLLLWAEGEAHQSLNVDQMLYLSVAYDWFLFGHQLAHRLKKGHEIMFYTYDVLGHLLSPDFSLTLGNFEHESQTSPRSHVTGGSAPVSPRKSSTTQSPSRLAASSSSSDSTLSVAIDATAKPAIHASSAPPSTVSSNASTPLAGSPAPTHQSNPSTLPSTDSSTTSFNTKEHTPASPSTAGSATSPILSPLPVPAVHIVTSPSESSSPVPVIALPLAGSLSNATTTVTGAADGTTSPRPSSSQASTSGLATPGHPAGSRSASPRREKVTLEDMLSKPLAGLDRAQRIEARKHRLFELRERFFQFYKAHIYPTYHHK